MPRFASSWWQTSEFRGRYNRVAALVIREMLAIRYDRASLSLMLLVPLMQLLLFGYAIDTDPRHLPTAVVVADQSAISRTVLSALINTGYMDFTYLPRTEAEANALLQRGDVQFVVKVPSDFTRRLVRGERTQVLIDADATDPMTATNSLAAAGPAIEQALARDLIGPLQPLGGHKDAVELVIHRRYNPEGKARLNTVPGLLGVILSVSMVLMTAVAVTREHELGTMENLLATPLRPMEVMVGKIVPFFLVGSIQTAVILFLSWLLFGIGIRGSLGLFLFGVTLFVLVNLSIGFMLSTVARNQYQAMQLAFAFLLPAILLSGFLFPFRGMPVWAQIAGELLPVTHFIRIARGVMLKGATFDDVARELAALGVMLVVVSVLTLSRYRQTLDTGAKPAA